MTWPACNDIHKIWSSRLSNDFNIEICRATVEPILLYGSETWTLSRNLERILDGTHTCLLMRAQNLSWKCHPTIAQIYGKLPRVSTLVKSRRVQFAGHCFRADSEIISSLLISRDTVIRTQDLGTVIKDREDWRSIVDSMLSTAVD